MAESRRLRTQAERGPEAWRQVADTRRGYATYPTSRPGDPSWWLRPVDGVEMTMWQLGNVPGAQEMQPGPPPVDGETCKQWCGYCHLGTDQSPTIPQQPPADRSWIEMTGTPPRRRWWHRYTRRNP